MFNGGCMRPVCGSSSIVDELSFPVCGIACFSSLVQEQRRHSPVEGKWVNPVVSTIKIASPVTSPRLSPLQRRRGV